MKRLLIYLKDYKLQCIMAPLFKMLEALFELFVPLVMASIIDDGISLGNKGVIWSKGAVLLALAFIGLVCSVTAQYFSAKAATQFSRGLRSDLFKHIKSLSYADVDGLGTSTLITRLTSDTNQIQNGVNMVLRLLLRSPFVVFGAMIMAFTIDVKSALIFVVAIPLLAIVVVGITVITLPMYRKVQSHLDGVTGKTRENLNGVRVIRAFNKEADELDEFNVQNDALSNLQLVTGRISALSNPLTFIIVNAATITLIYSGAIRVDAGVITQGEVVALVNYMSQILVELIKFTNLIVTITKALACANRVADILDIKPSIESGSDKMGSDLKTQGLDICFDNVSFKYNGASEESLSNVNINIKAGQTIGIIGSTGSGKSSLVQLIPRFYDITSGSLKIGGKEVADIDIEMLRKDIGFVHQKSILFKGSIRDNIRFGNEDATDEEIWEALRVAQAESFVKEKEGGLDYEIAQGGRNLSGGQKQRLTIARAVVRHPRILILDDSASALDYMTDSALRQEIAKLDNSMTILIVSQRTSSIKNADLIVVLDDGQIVGQGTHDELMKNCDVYQEIYYSQYEREEASNG